MSGKGLAARGVAVVRGAGLAALVVPGLLVVGCLYICAIEPWLFGSVGTGRQSATNFLRLPGMLAIGVFFLGRRGPK